MQKNISSQIWTVYAFLKTTGAPVTGDAANISATLRQDGGTSAPLTDAHPDELASGYYKFNMEQAETNASHLLLIPISTTANVIVIGCPPACWTEPASQKYAASLAPADCSGNLPAEVKAQDNIDFGALQKASLNAATPVLSGTLGDSRIGNLDAAITSRLAASGLSTIESDLSDIKDSLELSGSKTYTDTVQDPDGDPIDGVQIEAYSDSDRTTLTAIQTTDVNGAFTFHINAGTYYLRATKAGYTFDDWTKVIS